MPLTCRKLIPPTLGPVSFTETPAAGSTVLMITLPEIELPVDPPPMTTFPVLVQDVAPAALAVRVQVYVAAVAKECVGF